MGLAIVFPDIRRKMDTNTMVVSKMVSDQGLEQRKGIIVYIIRVNFKMILNMVTGNKFYTKKRKIQSKARSNTFKNMSMTENSKMASAAARAYKNLLKRLTKDSGSMV